MTLPHFYKYNYGPPGDAIPISLFSALFRSDDYLPFTLILVLAIVQCITLISLWRRPMIASVALFFFGSLSYFFIGFAALLFRIAYATQTIGLWDGPSFPSKLIEAECIAAIGALASCFFMIVGLLFYVFRWRHSISITYFTNHPASDIPVSEKA